VRGREALASQAALVMTVFWLAPADGLSVFACTSEIPLALAFRPFLFQRHPVGAVRLSLPRRESKKNILGNSCMVCGGREKGGAK